MKDYLVTISAVAAHNEFVEVHYYGSFASAYSAVCWYEDEFQSYMDHAYQEDWELLNIRVRSGSRYEPL